MQRPTTIIALVQILCVILGLVGLASVLKLDGYPNIYRWNRLTVFMRENGTWFLLTALVWLIYACVSQRVDRGVWSYKIACTVGILMNFGTLYLFYYAATARLTWKIFGIWD